MVKSPTLNRRHKVGLLLVVAGAGVSLILDASVKQTLGLVLVGAACVWLLASLSLRTGSLLLCAAGLSVPVILIIAEWNSFRGIARAYDAAVAEVRQATAKAPLGKLVMQGQDATFSSLPTDFFTKNSSEQFAYLSREDRDFSKATPTDQKAYIEYLTKSAVKTVDLPEDAQRWERPGKTQGKWLYVVADGDTVRAMIFPATLTSEEIVKSIQANELRPRPTFSLWNAIRSHAGTSLAGIVFVAVGLIGFILGTRPSTE